jgi:hypothetical protein
VVILPVGFDQACLKVLANAGKQFTQCLMGGFRQNTSAVFGHEDQMDV